MNFEYCQEKPLYVKREELHYIKEFLPKQKEEWTAQRTVQQITKDLFFTVQQKRYPKLRQQINPPRNINIICPYSRISFAQAAKINYQSNPIDNMPQSILIQHIQQQITELKTIWKDLITRMASMINLITSVVNKPTHKNIKKPLIKIAPCNVNSLNQHAQEIIKCLITHHEIANRIIA